MALCRKLLKGFNPLPRCLWERALCVLLAPLLFSCSVPEPEIVKSLRFEPPLFDSFKQNTYLRYTLTKPAEVSIYILTTATEKELKPSLKTYALLKDLKATVGKATTTTENSKQQESISALL
jgi:hypothetical protein